MKKEKLEAGLLAYITDIENLEDTLLIATSYEWELFGTLLNNRFLQENSIAPGLYGYLMDRGLIFSFFSGDKLYFIMPDEVKNIYNSIDKS